MTRKFFVVILAVLAVCVSCGQVVAATSSDDVTNADIVFFIDSSGSMQDDIDGVRTNLVTFSNSLISNDINARFAVVEYRYDNGVVVHKPNSVDIWTSDVSQVENVLSTIYAYDGDGDTLEAINEVFSWGDFRSNASRFGFILTDVMHIEVGDDSYYGIYDGNSNSLTSSDIAAINALMEDTISQLQSMDMRMSVISTPGLRSPYKNLYAQTNGAFIDITTSDYYKSMIGIARWISEEATTEDPLPYVMIEPVPEDTLNYVSESGDTVLQRIARLANISVDQINVITPETLELGLPHEPTEAMKKKAKDNDREFIGKIDTLTPRSESLEDGEQGYFLFMINIPEEILSMDLKVKDLTLWYASPDEFNASVNSTVSVNAAFDPFIVVEITDMWGFEVDTVAEQMLVLILANAGESLTMWLLKILLILAGCNTGTFAGVGAVSLLCVGISIIARKKFRR